MIAEELRSREVANGAILPEGEEVEQDEMQASEENSEEQEEKVEEKTFIERLYDRWGIW